ncbi:MULTISPECIES: hypothetical protein [Streptomyces]|uniref:Secreted protein n=1 Tax=Streptomyces chartreusis NRRL 3882 TaxID=1079985 RepID=A0A2N9B3K2_STRCX|nr:MULTISPECIES: hypothetical protein [Streptomyces]MYS91630.1 hypothetical protein [Streptomyces sp. SID5464]SOR77911.1 hypothetical protein SCNRRL3882_1380 [Streptomyces chartreusis NRRL 3882]
MRRTRHALSVAVLAGSALTGFAPVVAAEPAAEVSPATVEPGGTLTISVSCDPTGGPPPDTIDATSQAFDEGTVPLRKVTGNDDEVSGPAYRGTARIAPADNFEDDPDALGEDSAWTVDGTCPAAPGAEGKEWSATFTVAHGGGAHHKPSHEPTHEPSGRPCPDEPHDEPRHHSTECGGAVVQRGVRAGDGGAFTDSVPALVAGGVLIAGAFGAAVHRLRHRESDPYR